MDGNQYGFVLGGPIVQNRAFFFADYDGRFSPGLFGRATTSGRGSDSPIR
jgi:hypothetical protein